MKCSTLTALHKEIKYCTDCRLRIENDAKDIKFCDIVNKPKADIIFMGRDPNPWSAPVVGDLGNSAPDFHKEIINIIQSAGVSEEHIYVTNILKCHWQIDSHKFNGLEYRREKNKPYLNGCAEYCIKWLFEEIEIINPRVIICFSDDTLLALSKYFIPNEINSCTKISETEQFQLDNNTPYIEVGEKRYPIYILRHPGFTHRIHNQEDNIYTITYNKIKEKVINYLAV